MTDNDNSGSYLQDVERVTINVPFDYQLLNDVSPTIKTEPNFEPWIHVDNRDDSVTMDTENDDPLTDGDAVDSKDSILKFHQIENSSLKAEVLFDKDISPKKEVLPTSEAFYGNDLNFEATDQSVKFVAGIVDKPLVAEHAPEYMKPISTLSISNDRRSSDVRRIDIRVAESSEETSKLYHNTLCTCKCCELLFPSQNRLQHRNEMCHGQTCAACGCSFTESAGLDSHKKTCVIAQSDLRDDTQATHVDKNVRFQCEFCQIKFSNLADVKLHLRVHKTMDPYSCSTCLVRFTNIISLTNHLRVHWAAGKAAACNVCGKSFASKVGLTMHKRVHAPVACPVCALKFPNDILLYQHIQVTDHKQYQCLACKCQFETQAIFNAHKRLCMSGVAKQHECPICETRFRVRYEYDIHLRWHANRRAQERMNSYRTQKDETCPKWCDEFWKKMERMRDVETEDKAAYV